MKVKMQRSIGNAKGMKNNSLPMETIQKFLNHHKLIVADKIIRKPSIALEIKSDFLRCNN